MDGVSLEILHGASDPPPSVKIIDLIPALF